MKNNERFIQLAGMAMVACLLLFSAKTNAQSTDSSTVIQVMIDGASTYYYEGNCGYTGMNWGGAVTGKFCAPAGVATGIVTGAIACDSIAVDGTLVGKVAIVDRGTCALSAKAWYAQKAGAVGILIIQQEATPPDDCVSTTASAGTDAPQVTIPVFAVCRTLGKQIKDAITAGKSVDICFLKPDIVITRFFFPVSHVQTPVSQIAKDTFRFSATVSNRSATVARTNVVVTAKVLKNDGAELYTTSFTIPELAPGVADSFIALPGLYAPELPLGSYSIEYTTKSDPLGGIPSVQDREANDFFVTQNLFANDNGATNSIRPSNENDYAVGALYTMQAGSMEKYVVKQVEFSFSTVPNPFFDVKVTAIFFRINDDIAADYSNFVNDEGLESPSMELKGVGFYDKPVGNYDFILQKVDLHKWIAGQVGEVGVAVDAGARYMVVFAYFDQFGQTFHGINNNVDLPGVSTPVYGYNGFYSRWFLGGFRDGTEAVARMYIDLATKTDEIPLPQSVMQIIPNPVRDNLNLAVQFDQPTDATITIADINGRVIAFEDRQSLTNETLYYPLQVAAGIYLARIATKEGTLTKQFVVVK